MKRNSTQSRLLFSYRGLLTFSLLISLSSCSWLSSRKSLFGDEEEKPEVPESVQAPAEAIATGTVSRAEYNQLLKKYEALKTGHSPRPSTMPMQGSSTLEDPSDLVDQLNRVSTKPELAETVDVFGRNGLANSSASTARRTMRKAPAPIIPRYDDVSKKFSGKEIEYQIQELRKAQSLMAQNRHEETLKVVKKLEESSIPQVRVRAKFIFGELLFAQEEYDLAMQVYEEIIRREAFSGVVIKTLGRLIVCSEKLKQGKKQEQYYSLLNDILGSV